MDETGVNQWFAEYLNAFAACGRREKDATSLLAYYGVPWLVTTDDGFFALTSEDQVVAGLRQQLDGMRAAGYNSTEVLDSSVTVLNSKSALIRATYSWKRSDGSQIRRVTLTYLVTDAPVGRRISSLAVHSA